MVGPRIEEERNHTAGLAEATLDALPLFDVQYIVSGDPDPAAEQGGGKNNLERKKDGWRSPRSQKGTSAVSIPEAKVYVGLFEVSTMAFVTDDQKVVTDDKNSRVSI